MKWYLIETQNGRSRCAKVEGTKAYIESLVADIVSRKSPSEVEWCDCSDSKVYTAVLKDGVLTEYSAYNIDEERG